MTEPDSHTDSEQSAEIEHFNYVQGDAEEEQAGSEGIDESSSPPNEASGSTTTSKIPTVNQEMQLETTEMLPNQAADLESGLSQIEAGENESTAPLEAPPPSNSAAEDRSGVSPNEADPAQPRKKRSDSLLRLRLAMRFIRKASSHAPTKNVVDTLPTANYASSFAPSSESQERNVTINVHPSQLPSQIHLDYRPSVASVHVMGRDSRNTLTGRRLSFDGGLAGISSLDVSTSSGTLSSTKGSNWAVAEQIEKNDTLSPSNAGPSPGRSRRSSLSVTPQAAGLSSGGRSRRSSISCGPPPPGLAHMAIVAPKLQTVQGSVMDADATGAALAAELSRADRVRLSIERTVAWDPVLLRRPLPLLSGDSEIPALQGSPEIPGTKEIIIAKGRPTVRDIEATRRSDIDTAESAIPVIQPNLEGPGEDGIPEMTIKNNLEPRTLIPVPVTKLRSVDVVPITLSEIDCAPSAAVDLLEQTPAERSSQGELADLNEENPAIGNNPGVKLSSQGGRRITILTKQGLKTLVLSRVPCDSSMDGFLSTKRTLGHFRLDQSCRRWSLVR
ncbi:hypothetical protein DFJ73DRAFT_500535 [Zopfochytrium polystomum]|nr:hypothetical protein DFJ73DRAFT_500535 [Zopfochytrium polystomum]